MKRNIRKKLRNNKGITLVALVITIIVLLILAGVALSSVLSQDGIFNRAEQATDKYGQAKARETLELALGEAQMQKYEEGLTEEQLNNQIAKIEGELLPKEKPNPNLQNVIVDGYIFEIDRSIPKIVDYIGLADGIIITAYVTGNDGWVKPDETVTVKGSVKKYGGGTVVSSSATATNGVTMPTDFPTAGGSFEIPNISVDTDIAITATDSEGNTVSKKIEVKIRRDGTAPTVESLDAKVEGMKIIFTATGNDRDESGQEGSGIKHFNYKIISTDDPTLEGISKDKRTGTFLLGEVIELSVNEQAEYTIIINAVDNCDNKSIDKSAIVDTFIKKYINLTTGKTKVKTRDIYGSTVTGYTCERTDVEWQIFYIDEVDNDRVYLISKDFMDPPTIDTKLTKSTNENAYYWNATALSNSKISVPNTTFTTKFLGEYVGENASSRVDLQATNYMLDQTIWDEYLNVLKADFAFGGATLPLFVASFNDICKPEKKLDYKKDNITYKIKCGVGDWSSMVSRLGNFETQKGIYFKSNLCMWLASPSTFGNSGCPTYAGADGGIANYGNISYDEKYLGFRPIISLKSDVQFISNSNGTYTIK